MLSIKEKLTAVLKEAHFLCCLLVHLPVNFFKAATLKKIKNVKMCCLAQYLHSDFREREKKKTVQRYLIGLRKNIHIPWIRCVILTWQHLSLHKKCEESVIKCELQVIFMVCHKVSILKYDCWYILPVFNVLSYILNNMLVQTNHRL